MDNIYDAGLVKKYHKILPFVKRPIKCPVCFKRNVHQIFYNNETGDDRLRCFSCGYTYL